MVTGALVSTALVFCMIGHATSGSQHAVNMIKNRNGNYLALPSGPPSFSVLHVEKVEEDLGDNHMWDISG